MKTIREIKEELQAASGTDREKLLEQHREDSRSGVVSLVKKYDREKELLEKEKHRIEDMKVYENYTYTFPYPHFAWNNFVFIKKTHAFRFIINHT